MNNKISLDRWCDRTWIKVGCVLTAAMTAAVLINRQAWSDELKILAGAAALIPIHVVEEWVFPGGFHYHYNLLMRSDAPNSTPMCRLSDMFTNFLTTIMYILLTILCAVRGAVPTGLIMATFLFGCLEVFAHTMFGVLMYIRFRSKGKTTIYGPGSITAYLGFGVLAVLSFDCLRGQVFAAADCVLCICILGIILFGFILIPENLIRRKKRRSYAFESAGYYERFL